MLFRMGQDPQTGKVKCAIFAKHNVHNLHHHHLPVLVFCFFNLVFHVTVKTIEFLNISKELVIFTRVINHFTNQVFRCGNTIRILKFCIVKVRKYNGLIACILFTYPFNTSVDLLLHYFLHFIFTRKQEHYLVKHQFDICQFFHKILFNVIA